MTLRCLLAAAILAIVPASALAQTQPLTGVGTNIAPIASVKAPGANEVALAGDWAFVSADAGSDACGCLYIVNIADPAHPFIEGTWDSQKSGLASQSYGDVDISPDGNLTVLTNAHGSGPTWVAIVDTHDKAHPKLLSQIDNDGTEDYVHTSTLDNHLLYLNPQVFAGYPQPQHAQVTVVDIKDPAHPKVVGKISTPASDAGIAHDTYIDHRPDGKTLMYAASIHRSDVLDITDPLAATWLQTTTSYDYTISHDVQPNFDRSILILDDEGAAGSACGHAGTGPATVDSGSVHFYPAAADGTFANAGAVQLGAYNAPPSAGANECVAHVFWTAPNENRMTQAYYSAGAYVIDFSDPANPATLGSWVGDGATYWSNKPHNGYLYASNMSGSIDVLKYTGEGGTRWPATAGPAEIQLSARQGVPYVPIAGAPSAAPAAPLAATAPDTRTFGRFAFKAKARKVPGRAGRRTALTLTFTNAAKKVVSTVRVKRAAGRRATLKVSGVALTGSYGWTLKAGKKKLARGRFKAGVVKGLQASPGATVVARVKG